MGCGILVRTTVTSFLYKDSVVTSYQTLFIAVRQVGEYCKGRPWLCVAKIIHALCGHFVWVCVAVSVLNLVVYIVTNGICRVNRLIRRFIRNMDGYWISGLVI